MANAFPVINNNHAQAQRKRENQYSKLLMATVRGDNDTVASLIADGAPVENERRSIGPIFHAVEQNNAVIVKLLLDAGAHLNRTVNISEIYVAALNGNTEIVDMLISARANVNAGREGQSPLYAAASKGHVEVVGRLIKAGADKDAFNWDGEYYETALHAAVKQGNIDVVHTLVDNRADIKAENALHETPLDLAYKHNQLDIARFLIKQSSKGFKIYPSSFGNMHANAWRRRKHVLLMEGGKTRNKRPRRHTRRKNSRYH